MKKKLLNIIVWIVCLSSIISWVAIIYSDDPSSSIDFLYFVVWALIYIVCGIILIFSLAAIFRDKTSIKKFLVYLLLTAVILVGSYLVSSGDVIKFIDGTESSYYVSRFTGMGINIFYIFALASILAVLIGELKSLKK